MGVIHEEIRERHNSHTIPALIRDLRDEGIILVRQELELAKTELAEKTSHVARNSAYMGVGAGVIFAGFLFLLAAATESLTIGLTDAGLAEWAAPLSALIVGVIVAAIGVAVALKGKRAVAEVSPIPEKTLETLKEDKRWAEQKLKPDNHR